MLDSHRLIREGQNMPKYKTDPFVQLSRSIFHEDCNLSYKAKWLYTVLSELEHRYTGDKTAYFFRDQITLAKDTGMSVKANRKYRNELVDSGYLTVGKMHWFDKETGKKSEKHVTTFTLLV